MNYYGIPVVEVTRANVVQGLRELADFFESNEQVPVGADTQCFNVWLYGSDAKDQLAAAATGSGKWEKGSAYDTNFYLRKTFGEGTICYDMNVQREQVCRKVVTGTEVVQIEAVEAHEEVRETHEWVCEPILVATHVGE